MILKNKYSLIMLDPVKVRAEIMAIRTARNEFFQKHDGAVTDEEQIDFEREMTLEYPYTALNAKTLFVRECRGTSDEAKVETMLTMMDKMAAGNTTKAAADREISQNLTTEFVSPLTRSTF
jgi:hypothetical protein